MSLEIKMDKWGDNTGIREALATYRLYVELRKSRKLKAHKSLFFIPVWSTVENGKEYGIRFLGKRKMNTEIREAFVIDVLR